MWYTYKLTADSDDRYYLGVRHCPKNRTPDTDEYLGSGMSEDFIQWRKLHLNLGDISKEIIETFEFKDAAYLSEEHLIGNLWQTDPLILNSSPGGKWNGRLLPYPPCVECKAGSGNHWVHCSKYKERGECVECGGKSSNHKRICSKAILCVECSGAQGRHKRSCSLYVVTDPCEECGAPKLHRKFCSKIKLCSECKSFVGSHKWECSLGVRRADCGECDSPINAHKKFCSKWNEPKGCPECRSPARHLKTCSQYKSANCMECGGIPGSHKNFCSSYKKRISCKECGSSTVIHKKICSNFTVCGECGNGTRHLSDCSRPGRVLLVQFKNKRRP